MNIFALDQDPKLAARYHCDKHITKLLLESVQILNTSLHKRGLGEMAFYKPAYENHPCVIWATESWANFEWLLRLVHHLDREWRTRYNHDMHHTSYQKVLDNWYDGEFWILPATQEQRTPFAQAMPDDVKSSNAIDAYRDYYREYKASEDWFKFDNGRDPPEWLSKDLST